MNDTKLSVIIITRNEEQFIKACLESVVWADEIILVDNNSSDKTVDIAGKFKAKIFKTEISDFSTSRNIGLKNANGKWILYVDADERVTPELKAEVLDEVNKNASRYSAFAIPRSNIILGKKFRHGGQWPDYVKRLYLRRDLKGWSGKPHEEPDFVGEMGHLKNHLVHNKHEDFSQMVEKTNEWSWFEAKLMYDAHHPPMTVSRFLTALLREFWLRMVKQLAFLDGPKGIMYAMYQVFSRFISYAKLWEMQIGLSRHQKK